MPSRSLVNNHPSSKFQSNSVKGKCGCAVWISKSLPLGSRMVDGHESKVYVNRKDIAILSGSHRYSLVRIATELCKILVVVLHVPDSGYTFQQVLQFYQHVETKVARHRRPDDTILLFVDANTDASGVRSPRVGTYGKFITNERSVAFGALLATLGVWLPSTFADNSIPGVLTGTWFHTYDSIPHLYDLKDPRDFICSKILNWTPI